MFSILNRVIPERIKAAVRAKRPQNSLESILSATLPKMTCIDVGASYYPHGKWSAFLKSSFVRWIAVEPNKDNLKYTDPWMYPSDLSVCTTGLSEAGGSQYLYVTNVDSGSSLLEPVISQSMKHRVRNEYLFPYKTVKIDTLKLSDLLGVDSGPILIKLDTQGTELSILRGAHTMLVDGQIVGIEMESTLLAQPFMKGSGKFWEACRYLEDCGFELLHLNPIYAEPRMGKASPNSKFTYLNECDAVFVRRRDLIDNMSTAHKMTLLAFYCSYSFYEEALLFLEESEDLKKYLIEKGYEFTKLRNLLTELL